ncbi:MAG: ribbon-helix-helix protein, CopG family [Alphaproteobacteria bacterium]|nr:MAG: ribbon-helix-helix protein, CopG family [Alphaproteobacteria bacterium]
MPFFSAMPEYRHSFRRSRGADSICDRMFIACQLTPRLRRTPILAGPFLTAFLYYTHFSRKIRHNHAMEEKPPKKARSNFTLTGETTETLERMKKETGLSMSALVRMAVRMLDESDALEPFKKS